MSFEDFDDPVKEERRDSRRFESRDDSDGRRFERRDGGGDSNFGERRRERGDEDRREESKGDRKDEIKGDRREATEEGDNWSEKDKRRNPTLQEKSVSSNDYVNEDSFRAAWKASAERSPAGDDDFYSPSPPSIYKK